MKKLISLMIVLLFVGIFPVPGFVWKFAPHASAQGEPPPTIIVNTTLDDPRGCPERCTLRSAIAMASPGDVIGFDPVVSGVLVLVQPLVIDKDLTINGPGAELFAIDGSERLRVLEIPAGVTVSISGLTIQNAGDSGIYSAGTLTIIDSVFFGNSVDYYRGSGGGIYNDGDLTIANSTFSDNSADEFGRGGAIYNNGTLNITDSAFSGNSGGGIWNERGLLTISNSTFSSNSAGDGGGGIWNERGLLTISDSTFSDNSANQGGGILNKGDLTIANSTFSGNVAHNGGGISNRGSLVISSSTFSNNSSDGNGGGIDNAGSLTIADSTYSGNSAGRYGGGIINGGSLMITNSTFSDNSANENGGGIWNNGSITNLTIADSTFSGNSAGGNGGSIWSLGDLSIINSSFGGNTASLQGGGIYNDGDLIIVSSTFSSNTAGSGGAIFVGTSGAIDLSNSIVAGNIAAEGPDIFGEVNSLSGNLVGDPQGALGLWASDLLEGDLLLGPLADNGGPTQTMALLAGSPAIDAIPAEYCVWDDDSDPDTPPVPLLTDQRGAPRTGPCDIGAFEFGAVPPG